MNRIGRRQFLKQSALGAALAASACAGVGEGARPAAKRPPNIVLILADDLGYGDVGCYGATKVATPHIDQLAQEGMRFTDAHAPAAVCTPTRYGLLTGRYWWRREGRWNRNSLLIEQDRTTLASLMKDAGYATGCVGKWHLGFGDDVIDWNKPLRPGPLDIGFDSYFGTPMSHNEPPHVFVEDDHVVGLDPNDPLSITKPGEGAHWGVTKGGQAARFDPEHLGTTLAGKAVSFIDRHKDEPFFLYLATTNIHWPLVPHPRFKGASPIGTYGDFIQELDWIVGEVLSTLERHGLADDTLILFSSDNGAVCTREAFKQSHHANGDFLGQKTDVWEGGHRVPLLARWPHHIEPDSQSDALVCLTDMLATFAELNGRALRADEGTDSISMLPILLGAPNKGRVRDHLVMQGVFGFAVRQGNWLLIDKQGSCGFTTGDVKSWMQLGDMGVVHSDYTPEGELRDDAPPSQLYNLVHDPRQSKNLYVQHPEKVEQLRALFARLKKEGRSAVRSDNAPPEA